MKRMTGLLLGGAMLLGSIGPLVSNADAQSHHRRRAHQTYRNNNGDYRPIHRGGIGPGKGALIGGAGGAGVGALVGGGKGALIGGAIGAGGGALLGKNAQDRRNNQR